MITSSFFSLCNNNICGMFKTGRGEKNYRIPPDDLLVENYVNHPSARHCYRTAGLGGRNPCFVFRGYQFKSRSA